MIEADRKAEALEKIVTELEKLVDLATALLKLKMAELESQADLLKRTDSSSTVMDQISEELNQQREAFKNRGQ